LPSIVRSDPFRSIFSLPRLLDEFEEPIRQRGLKIHETETDLVIEGVVAGVPAKDVDINIEDGVLTIKAEVHEESKKDNSYASANYQYYYTVALSGGQWDKANAEVENGIVKSR
jgi:HSP20 family molecular chaperone IbpA